jgi:hypothetical protein
MRWNLILARIFMTLIAGLALALAMLATLWVQPANAGCDQVSHPHNDAAQRHYRVHATHQSESSLNAS